MVITPKSNPPLDRTEIALVAKTFGRRQGAAMAAKVADKIAALPAAERALTLAKLALLAPFRLGF